MIRQISFALLLGGCASASSSQISSSPDRYDITCRQGLGYCHREAASVCPGGYKVVDGADRSTAYVQHAGSVAYVTPVYNGEIIVECAQ